MSFLALELWPYILGALALGVATGWFSGCAARIRRDTAEAEGPSS